MNNKKMNNKTRNMVIILTVFIFLPIFLVLLFMLPVFSHVQKVPRFEPSACLIDIPDNPPIDCGYLEVPEDHRNPESPPIQLPVIIIHSRSEGPAPDPLLCMTGEAIIDCDTTLLNGRGVAKRTPMCYWWL